MRLQKQRNEEFTDTQKAIRNRDFRLAFMFGFDTKAYRAQNVGEEGAIGAYVIR